MENEVPFAADVDIDAQLQARTTASNLHPTQSGTEYVSKDTVSLQVHEETPLLPRGELGGAFDDTPPWSDPSNEMGSQTWWRRPSVRITSQTFFLFFFVAVLILCEF